MNWSDLSLLRKQESRVILAQAGTQGIWTSTTFFTTFWIPAFAGMTSLIRPLDGQERGGLLHSAKVLRNIFRLGIGSGSVSGLSFQLFGLIDIDRKVQAIIIQGDGQGHSRLPCRQNDHKQSHPLPIQTEPTGGVAP